MKKMQRVLPVLLVVAILLSINVSASTHASYVLDTIMASMTTGGNGTMRFSVYVDGTQKLSKVGIDELVIQESSSKNGPWSEYDTWYGEDNPGLFYDTNVASYQGDFSFTGTPGKYYRIIVKGYGELPGVGSDTSTFTSTASLCR